MCYFRMELMFSPGAREGLRLVMQGLIINPAFLRKHVRDKLLTFMALQREFPCLENTAF